jgi:hypothetical protein
LDDLLFALVDFQPIAHFQLSAPALDILLLTPAFILRAGDSAFLDYSGQRL